MYDDYIKGDGMDPIGTAPDDLKLNSLGTFYTNLGSISSISVTISRLLPQKSRSQLKKLFSFRILVHQIISQ